MNKLNPITIGIIALLLVLLVFNFIPDQESKPIQQKIQTAIKTKPSTQETQETQETNNMLIQKNLDFLEENLPLLKENLEPKTKPLPTTPNPESLAKETNTPKTTQICQRTKPQLAIIIDDISNYTQYRRLQEIPYKITPSFFPKTIASKNTPQIAATAPFYMVHLPLEALNFYQKEHLWLFSNDSKQIIQDRIQAIKKDFPNLTYINNHTGSKFTQDPNAMQNLLAVLNENKITFVDSKTTPKTKTALYYKNNPTASLNPCQNTPFLERNIFLDNELNISKITQNFIKAIETAKSKGYAIAIGHPHKETILALKNASEYLQKSGVEAVYINELIIP
ncbi:divergent polysaccharide deacetylase family protein [Helicobacter sp.]|uniref:divergent polysaccharide deacetylase family protein n=1 Tax=Helicobacter sp. TaxID=218 RepID=UPI0025825816|nr:divergent polysaccharide deacetylase family protein [Helicobacter sp.]MCI7766109.1 divergent polysaccharide deacetylase family protein [Helicobacter sp.]MDY5616836.1 divergent polysaccharide deacetylase family protein [Helicobacter sp.]